MEKTDVFLNAMRHRFACKKYKKKSLSVKETDFLAEVAVLSPSTFGFEPWEFVFAESPDLRERLLHACFEQESMKTAPLFVIALAHRAKDLDPDGSFVAERGARFPGELKDFVEDYRGYYEFLRDAGRLDSWLAAQTYIPIANMMSAAASIGIQSCAIEGFNNEKVLEVLGISPEERQVGLIAVFGYPDEPERPKIREKIENLVDYR